MCGPLKGSRALTCNVASTDNWALGYVTLLFQIRSYTTLKVNEHEW